MYRYSLFAGTLAAAVFGMVCASAAAGSEPAFAKLDGDVIVRAHFVGGAELAADAKAAKLNKIFAVPATAALKERIFEGMSTAPYRFLKPKIDPQTTNDFGALLRPILEDLWNNESYWEMRNPSSEVPELLVAVHLNATQYAVWNGYLTTVLTAWTGLHVEPVQGDGYSGWELKKHENPNVIRLMRAGDWVLFGWGQDGIRSQQSFLDGIKSTKRPFDAAAGVWLDALVDWPAIESHYHIKLPVTLPANQPKVHLTVEGKGDFVRPQVVMEFAKPLDLKLDPWKFPMNYIHNPLVSFMAIRGVAPWLSEIPGIKELQANAMPNQLVSWSISGNPFDSSMAAPMPNASNYLARLAPKIVAEVNEAAHNDGIHTMGTYTNGRVKVTMPFISPYVGAVETKDGDFLLGGLFPEIPSKKAPPLPQDLMREIGSKPNLVMYSWEINSERLVKWQSVGQIYRIAAMKYGPSASSPGIKWLQAVGTNLSNCGTEVTLTGPNELKLVRNAPIGLSGLEMTALEYWIDSPEFPLSNHYPKPGMTPEILKRMGQNSRAGAPPGKTPPPLKH